MGILFGRDQLVNEGDEQHSAEKRQDGNPVPHFFSQIGSQRILGFYKNFDHGNVYHDTCGKSQTDGKKFSVCMFG